MTTDQKPGKNLADTVPLVADLHSYTSIKEEKQASITDEPETAGLTGTIVVGRRSLPLKT